MEAVINPGKLKGDLRPPVCKSQLIRAVFCASLAKGKSVLHGAELSGDVKAALSCAESLGVEWKFEDGTLTVCGGAREKRGSFDCGESAAVLRFAIPAALAVNGGGVFSGQGRLMERPLEEYRRLFQRCGTEWTTGNGDKLVIKGRLDNEVYEISGSTSSQFISGVLLALPAAGGGAVIIRDELCSSGYVDMTCAVMKHAGVNIYRNRGEICVDGCYRPFETEIERDWSNAAFFLAANAMGSDIRIDGLNYASLQPDRRIVDLLSLLSRPGYAEINVSQTPDLLPPLAAFASVREGKTSFTGAANLRYKECDRLAAITDILGTLGADVRQTPDALIISGREKLYGGRVDSHNDHRMAMMAAIAAAVCSKAVVISGAECTDKSYPAFFDDYLRLGGEGSVRICGE